MSCIQLPATLIPTFGKRTALRNQPSNVTFHSILKPATAHTDRETPRKTVRFTDLQSETLPVVPVTTSGFFQGLTAEIKVASQPCHAFFDSGAAVNIIKPHVFHRISDAYKGIIPHSPPDIKVKGISGTIVTPHSKVLLQLSLSPLEPGFCDYFYVIDDTCFSADVLIGFHTMRAHNIALFPASCQIAQNGTLIPANSSTTSHPPFPAPVTVFTPSIDSPPLLELTVVTPNHSLPSSELAALPSNALSSDPPVSSHANTLAYVLSSAKRGQAVLSSSVVVPQRDLCLVRVNVKDVSPGSDIVCLPDSARVNGVALESVLTTLEDDGSCCIAIQNFTNSPISLQSGVSLGDCLSFSLPVTPIDFSPCLVSQASPLDSDSTRQQPSDPSPILDHHLGHVDFPEAKSKLLDLLSTFRSCVSLPGEPLGKTEAVRHAINLIPDSAPTYVPAYRIPHSRRALVDEAVKAMINDDIVEPAASPFNAPLLLVPKPNGEWRVVVDFRALNSVTIPDRFPMPVLSDLLQSLGENNGVFSTLDLKSGFYQIELEEVSRPYTAFTTSSGQYMFKRMAMGLRNAPLTFTRLMNSVLAGLLGNSVFCYLDDVIVATRDIPEHLDTITQVLSCFTKAGLTLKLEKCMFLQSQIKFLGHRVDRNGIHTLDDKVHAITNFPTPSNADQIRSFIGLAGFYRQFIRDFSKIAQPLTSLLKKDASFTWNDEQQKAFDTLKQALTTAPILAFPNFNKEFILYTDASNIGIGAVLMQNDEQGKSRAIAYASRLLNSAERNYSVTNREALAVVWALRHFRDLILGYKIHVFTDHYAVTELFKGKNLSGKFARWQLTIHEYNPSFSHIPGKANTVADGLSRNVAQVTSLTVPPSLPTLDEIRPLQQSDQFCSSIIYYLNSGDASTLPKLPMSPDAFVLEDDILYKSSNIAAEDESLHHVSQLVIPQVLIPTILYHIHDSPLAGHPGKERSFRQAQRTYFWPSMRKDIQRHCLLCVSCAQHRPSPHHESPNLAYPIPHAPWDSVSIDVLKLPLTENGFQYLLVSIDSFSRYSILTPLKDKSARSVAQAFIDEVICRYASPKVLLSDNGLEFNNSLLEAVCDTFHIKKCNIVPYSPQANGKVERANRRILDVLRFIANSTSVWDECIPQVACSLNSAIHSSINESPHFILFGTDKRLPYEFLSSTPRPLYCLDDYVKRRVTDFQRIHTSVRDHLAISQADMLRKQHQRATPHEIEVGDIVFARVQDRPSKLDPLFYGPHRVTDILAGHKVKLLDLKSGAIFVTHKDHLKRVDRGFDIQSITTPPGHCQDTVLPPSTPSPPSHTPTHYNLRSRTVNSFIPSPFSQINLCK